MTVVARLSSALIRSYRIDRELGAGGMATVYLAHDLKHDRDVAIKVLHPDLGAALGGERFLSEIRTTARLQHPHILPLLDSGEADGLLYYVMPLVTGETLRARLERERQLPVDDTIRIAREVADALGYAHGLGVIHRDIKPENILLQNGHALVADFGIALAVQSAGGARMTQTGLSLGTPQYMSPEQAMGERAIDARSDIYALGAVTYEMLVGEPPFTGPSVQAIVARLITEEPRAIGTQRKAVPEQLDSTVMRALEKLPADRFASAAEFAASLTSGTATRATTRSAASHGAGSRERQRAWSVAGITLVALAAAGGWLLGRRGVANGAGTERVTMTSVLAPTGGALLEQRSLALSPDGSRLAFVFATPDGARSLWQRRLDRLEAEPIPRTEGASAPFWSPDGHSLGFFADGNLIVRDENGEPRRLCPVSQPTGGSWSSKGTILFGHSEGISMVPADGGTCRLVFARDSAPIVRGVFLPDGERFLVARGRFLDMMAVDLTGKVVQTLPVQVNEFAVVAAGYLLLPSRTDTRALDAQQFDLRTLTLQGPLVRIASDVRAAGGIHTFSVSSNNSLTFLPGLTDRPYLEYDATGVLRDTVRVEGTWTLFARPDKAGPPMVVIAGNTAGIWLYDLDSDRRNRVLTTDTTFVTTGMGLGTTWPVFSADGQQLAYALTGPTRCRVVVRDLKSGAARTIEEIAFRGTVCAGPVDWSPDGRNLLIRRDTMLELMRVDSAAPARQITAPGKLWEGRFSPDGRYVAYSSDETSRAEIYVQPLPSGLPVRISVEGGRWPQWSSHGDRLWFLTPDGRVQQVGFDSRTGTPVGAPQTRFSVPSWRRSTFEDRGTGFAMAEDGKRFLLRISPAGPAVAYIQNWTSMFQHAATSSR